MILIGLTQLNIATTMQNFKLPNQLFLKTIFLLIIINGISLQANSQISQKRIITWYVFEDGKSSFKDLEPVKDILYSISVFGNPPKSFIGECHKNSIEIFRAVGGNEQSINTSDKRQKLIESYVDDCIKNGYDGIDLDFENLNPDIEPAYSDFLITLSKRLHSISKKLSHCVGFYLNLYNGNDIKMFYNPKIIASTCDLVRVMCYDMYFAPGKSDQSLLTKVDCQGIGPTANYPFTRDAMNFWIKYVPKNKLVMGLPAYSNDYEIIINGKGKQIYSSIPDNVNGTLLSPNWLWYEKVNLYMYNDTNNHPHLFYASDEKSTEALLSLAKQMKINNIGFWHFSSVDSKMWNVVRQWTTPQK
jgi:Predicted glycosyl hydrolase